MTIGTNHIGHFLMMQLLLPVLTKTATAKEKARIVYTASGVHNPEEAGGNVGSKATLGDLSGFQSGFQAPITMIDNGKYDPDKSYKDSKLCNVITTLEAARRYSPSKVTVNCYNPGLVPSTGLFRAFSPLFVLPFTFLTRYIFKVAVDENEAGNRLYYMLTNPEVEGKSGLYYTGKAGKPEFSPYEPSTEAQDRKKAETFWKLSEKLVAAWK